MKLSKIFLLKAFLIYSAIGWGICLIGVVIPAAPAFNLLGYIGGIEPDLLQSDPMYAYWLRMAASVFAFVGILFLLPVYNLKKFFNLVPILGLFMVMEGLILMGHGIILHLPTTPLWGDVTFCLVGGIGIIFCFEQSKIS